MFKFLKDKLKTAVKSFTKQVEEAPETEQALGPGQEEPRKEEPKEVRPPEKTFLQKVAGLVSPREKEEQAPSPEPVSKSAELPAKKEPAAEELGFFQKVKQAVTTTKISEGRFEELFWDLEVSLLEANVAVEVIEKIKEDLKIDLVDRPLKRSEVASLLLQSLRTSLQEVLDQQKTDFFKKVEQGKKPFVIVFVGINGSGKTTTIAKLAYRLKERGITSVIAAADTFRAAAIQQLDEHGKRLGIKVIKQDYGADPAAVAFDARKYAEAKKVPVVLIDTAGRLHSNVNLIDEMKKIVRVVKPDLTLFVGESITGNDCVEQAREFNKAVSIDGIILAKADIDEKGGAALSVSFVTGKPIFFLGVGQGYESLEEFDSQKVLSTLGL